MRQEAGMKSSVRPDTTLNGSIRRHCEMTEPPWPEPVWVDSLAEEQMRDGSCHGLTWAACCFACFGGGGRSRAFTLSAVTGNFERFFRSVEKGFDLPDLWALHKYRLPSRPVKWRCVSECPSLCYCWGLKVRSVRIISIFSIEYWDEWKQHTLKFKQYA